MLSNSLAKCTALETLVMSNNYFGPEGVPRLLTAVGHCTSLVELRMSDNSVGTGEGARAVAQILLRFRWVVVVAVAAWLLPREMGRGAKVCYVCYT